tara:strand:+ start:616 stop:819 length:204 start_codon:yes stop_codon:yes gene_type:complete
MGDLIRLNSEYVSGMRAARAEVASGDIYCIESALMLYEQDPADSEFQRGHHRALINLHQQQGRKANV